MSPLKSFAALSAEWAKWEHTDVSARAFCDWIRDNVHLDVYWLDPLQKWLTGGGLTFFEAELKRLTAAEAAYFAREDARRGQEAS